jgi:hypothetical protein
MLLFKTGRDLRNMAFLIQSCAAILLRDLNEAVAVRANIDDEESMDLRCEIFLNIGRNSSPHCKTK